jgi:leucyl aminopeptidase (aminopeptidase T)
METVPLVWRVTERAYRARASLVTTLYTDDVSTRSRFRYVNNESFEVDSLGLDPTESTLLSGPILRGRKLGLGDQDD